MTVTPETFERYREGLLAMDSNGRGAAAWVGFRRVWNLEVAANPAWPQLAIPHVSHADWWTDDFDQWPSSLHAEFQAFERWARGEDTISKMLGVFGGRRRRRARRPTTVEGYGYLARAWFSAAIEGGIARERLTALADLMELDVIEAAVGRLTERSPTGSEERPFKCMAMLKVMADQFLRLEPTIVRDLADICRALRPERPDGLNEKNTERLAPLADPRRLREFMLLPERLMDRALRLDRDGDGGQRGALIAQQAVVVELLQTIPLRIGNLVRLRLDQHLSPLAVREGHALIMIPGHEVKNRRALRYPVMRQSCPRIRTYLDPFHPRLAGASSPWLFPGRNGRHKHVATLAGQITKLLRTELGLDFNPHQFRHFAGEHYLDAYKNDLEGAANLLGHDGTASVRDFYTSPRMKDAIERFDEVVLRLRSGLPATTTAKKKR